MTPTLHCSNGIVRSYCEISGVNSLINTMYKVKYDMLKLSGGCLNIPIRMHMFDSSEKLYSVYFMC